MVPLLLNETEAAKYVGLKKKTLQRRRWAGCSPSYIKVGGTSVRYSTDDLDAFLLRGRFERLNANPNMSKFSDLADINHIGHFA